jgi:hypothetical protein
MAVQYFCNIFLKEVLNHVWVNVTAQTVSINYYDLKTANGSGTGVGAGSVDGSEFDVTWVVQCYSYDSSTKKTTKLSGNDVTVTLSSDWAAQFVEVKTVDTSPAGSDFEAKWNRESTGYNLPYVIHPAFDVTLKSNNSNIPLQNISGANFTGIQSVTITKGPASTPGIPKGLINALNPNLPLGAEPNLSNIHYDASNKWFVGIGATYINGSTTYTEYIWLPGATSAKSITTLGTDKAGSKTAFAHGQQLLIQAINGSKVTNSTTPNTGGAALSPTTISSAPPEPTDQERWNPPPHDATKGNRKAYTYEQKVLDANGNVVTDKQISPAVYSGKLGRIYQDVNSAKTVNTTDSSSLWGFRFMYNPTTFQYNVGANTSVDWTLGNADPAALLAGNMTYSFQLYVNRILDLGSLSDNPNRGYTPALKPDQINGLLNRGTEFDIEYLYRVCNGDPDPKGNNPMITYSNGISSDIGILKALPVWLVFNDNMKLFGSVTSLTVNHVMFNLDMIPIFSTIDISFTRYPAIFNVNQTGTGTTTGIEAYKSAIGGNSAFTTTTSGAAGGSSAGGTGQ